MAFSTNTDIDFSTSSGYTLSNVTIGSGSAALTGTYTGTGTCETPDIDTSTWVGINRVAATQTQSVGMSIRHLVSFDSGSTWNRYDAGLWLETAASDIATLGMTEETIEAIRDWSPMASALNFLTGFTRATSSPTGTLSQWTVHYMAAMASPEPWLPGTEYSTTMNLENDLGIQPDFPVSVQRSWPHVATPFSGGYEQSVSTSTLQRRFITLRWTGLSDSNTADVISFLESVQTAAFTWDSAPGFADGTKFMANSEPESSQEHNDLWTVTCQVVEVP